MTRAYYNENDPFAAAWLRRLIDAGLITAGDVDDRDIRDVAAADLDGYTQHHFFAGIGGWPYALRLAGWPDDRPVVTGSCPCQPFSSAGKRKGTEDERHLWPAFRWLIAQLRPATCFGEQVASADGREWLAGVRADLEAMGYVVGAADLCAAGVGAPHKRQRIYWVADSEDAVGWCVSSVTTTDERRSVSQTGGCCGTGRMGDATSAGLQGSTQLQLGDSGAWSDYDIVWCDERFAGRGFVPRRVEPGSQSLASGVPKRVGRLRGYGNSIVPQVAAEFLKAYLDHHQ